jgi:hypothetical protein
MFAGKRIASIAVAGSLVVGGLVAAASPAAALSPAAQAFSTCMDHYLAVRDTANAAHQYDAATEVVYIGYTNCYYDLSQRNDITADQEISAYRNFEANYALALKGAYTVAGQYALKIIKAAQLRGLTL